MAAARAMASTDQSGVLEIIKLPHGFTVDRYPKWEVLVNRQEPDVKELYIVAHGGNAGAETFTTPFDLSFYCQHGETLNIDTSNIISGQDARPLTSETIEAGSVVANYQLKSPSFNTVGLGRKSTPLECRDQLAQCMLNNTYEYFDVLHITSDTPVRLSTVLNQFEDASYDIVHYFSCRS